MPAKTSYFIPQVNPWTLNEQKAPAIIIDSVVVGDGSDGYNITVNYSILDIINYSLNAVSAARNTLGESGIKTAVDSSNGTVFGSATDQFINIRKYIDATCYILPDESPSGLPNEVGSFDMYTRWNDPTNQSSRNGVIKQTTQSDNIITDFLINPLKITVPLDILNNLAVQKNANPERFRIISRTDKTATIQYDSFDAFASRKNTYFKDVKSFNSIIGNKKNSELEIYAKDPSTSQIVVGDAKIARANIGNDFFALGPPGGPIYMFRSVRVRSSFTAKNIKFNKGFTVVVVPTINNSKLTADKINTATFAFGPANTQKYPLGMFAYVPEENTPFQNLDTSNTNPFGVYPNISTRTFASESEILQYFTDNRPLLFLRRNKNGDVALGVSTSVSKDLKTTPTNENFAIGASYPFFNSATTDPNDRQARITTVIFAPKIEKQYLLDRSPKVSQADSFKTATNTKQIASLGKKPAYFSEMFSSFSVKKYEGSATDGDVIALRQYINQGLQNVKYTKRYARLTNFIFLDLFEAYKNLSPFTKLFSKSFTVNFFNSVYDQSGENSISLAKQYFQDCISGANVKIESFSSKDGINKKQIFPILSSVSGKIYNTKMLLSNINNINYTTTYYDSINDREYLDGTTRAIGKINDVEAWDRLTPIKLFSLLDKQELTTLSNAIPGGPAGDAFSMLGAQAYLGFVDGNLAIYDNSDYVDYDIEIKIKDPFQRYINEILTKASRNIKYLEEKANLLSATYGNYYDFSKDKLNPDFYNKFYDQIQPLEIAESYWSLELPFLENPTSKQDKIDLIIDYLSESTLTINKFNFILKSYKQKYSNLLEKAKTNDDFLTINKKTSKQYEIPSSNLYLTKIVNQSISSNAKNRQIQFSNIAVFEEGKEKLPLIQKPYFVDIITQAQTGYSLYTLTSIFTQPDGQNSAVIAYDEIYKKYFKKEWRRTEFDYTNAAPVYNQSSKAFSSSNIGKEGDKLENNLTKKMKNLIRDFLLSIFTKSFNQLRTIKPTLAPNDYGKFDTNINANSDFYLQFYNDFKIKQNNIRNPYSEGSTIFINTADTTDNIKLKIDSIIANQESLKSFLNSINLSAGQGEYLYSDYRHLFVFHLMIANLIKIEYLAGFNSSINEPIWKSFLFDGEVPAGRYLTRTRLIDASSAGYIKNEAFNFPIYEEYQLINKT